jgi:UDPglucose--hexose-1-phosphate uridylyltransferase
MVAILHLNMSKNTMFQNIVTYEGMNTSDEVRNEFVKQIDTKINCPFCAGNEKLSPKEILKVDIGEKNASGGRIRVVSDRFPISEIHENVIFSDDEKDFHNLPDDHVAQVFQVFKERFNFYKQMGRVLIFSNQGEKAGADMSHPYGQIIVLPMKKKLKPHNDLILQKLLFETENFKILYPEFSANSFEVIISDKISVEDFGALSDLKIKELAVLFKKIIFGLTEIMNEEEGCRNIDYNFYISSENKWFLRIIPRIRVIGSFELETGMSLKMTSMEELSKMLKDKLGIANAEPVEQANPEPLEKLILKTEEERMSDILGKLGHFGGSIPKKGVSLKKEYP